MSGRGLSHTVKLTVQLQVYADRVQNSSIRTSAQFGRHGAMDAGCGGARQQSIDICIVIGKLPSVRNMCSEACTFPHTGWLICSPEQRCSRCLPARPGDGEVRPPPERKERRHYELRRSESRAGTRRRGALVRARRVVLRDRLNWLDY